MKNQKDEWMYCKKCGKCTDHRYGKCMNHDEYEKNYGY